MGAGIALIVAGGFLACFSLGGYIETFAEKPWVEPVKWGLLSPSDRDGQLAKFRNRNRQFRPRLLVLLIIGLVLVVAGVVLLAKS